ncbi:hypothetical protein A2336_04515 [Candidatus Peregrinibacteria bacterium RIFOXYB2_FULL_41_88]|nr:MAG: hypothetical protein A2336_04515 [Candidatus Peregrinibacteria bacterium RIFOXYB2_FULL_41_88]
MRSINTAERNPDYVDPDDMDDRAIMQELARNSRGNAIYIGSPEDFDQLTEWIEECIEALQGDSRFGIRTSCVTGSFVIMVYESGGKQFHINTRKFDLDREELEELITDEYGKELFDVDNYLSDE